MPDQDQTIQCRDCTNEFVFTASEAQYFADNQLHTPKRCKDCRARKKAQNTRSEYEDAPVPQEEPQHQHRRKGGRRDDRDDRY